MRIKAAEVGQEHEGDTLTIKIGSEVLSDFYLHGKQNSFLNSLSNNLIGSLGDTKVSSINFLLHEDIGDEVKCIAREVGSDIYKYIKGKELVDFECVNIYELFNKVFPLFAMKLRSPFVKFVFDVSFPAGK